MFMFYTFPLYELYTRFQKYSSNYFNRIEIRPTFKRDRNWLNNWKIADSSNVQFALTTPSIKQTGGITFSQHSTQIVLDQIL